MTPERINDLEHGISAAVEAIIGVARDGMLKANARKDEIGPYLGFVQALVEHRDAFKAQILTVALASHPDFEED